MTARREPAPRHRSLLASAALCCNLPIRARSRMRRSPPAPTPPRFAAERQQRIAEALREHGRVEVSQLAAEYGVSEDSVRRDLRQLACGTRPGAEDARRRRRAARHAAADRAARRRAHRRQRAIARAARLVEANQTLFVDGGTTTLALVNELKASDAPRPLTIVTTRSTSRSPSPTSRASASCWPAVLAAGAAHLRRRGGARHAARPPRRHRLPRRLRAAAARRPDRARSAGGRAPSAR